MKLRILSHQLLQIVLQIHAGRQIGIVVQAGALVGAEGQDDCLGQAGEGQVAPVKDI